MGNEPRSGHRGRRAHGEGEQQALVLLGELGASPEPVEGGQHPELVSAEDQRDDQAGVGAQPALDQPEAHALGDVREAFGAAAAHHVSQHGLLPWDAHSPQVDVELAGGHPHHDVVALRQCYEEPPRVDERATALGDQLEHSVEVRLAADGAGDGGRGLELAQGAPQLVVLGPQASVHARVVDRYRGPARQDNRGLLVSRIEVPALLLREVQVAERLAADQHGNAEEGLHARVAGREAVGTGVIAHMLEAERHRVDDQLSEDPPSARLVPDGRDRLGVEARREEALQLAPGLVEHAEGGVARAGDRARLVEHAPQHRLRVQLRHQRPPHVDQALQTGRVERRGPRGHFAGHSRQRPNGAQDGTLGRSPGRRCAPVGLRAAGLRAIWLT